MKKFIFISFLIFSQVLFAESDSRKITNLQYLAPANIWHSNASFIYAGSSLGPSSIYSSSVTAMATVFNVGRTLGSFFDISLQQGYYLSNKQTVTYGPLSGRNGQTDTFNSSGLNDLSATFTARPLEIKAMGGVIVGDLFVLYSPSIIEAKSPSTTKSGTIGRGGSQTKFGIKYGHQWSGFELMLMYALDTYSQRSATDLSNNQTITSTGGNNGNFELGGQFNFSDNFQLSLVYDLYGVAQKTDTGSITITTLAYNYSMLGMNLNFKFKDSFILQVAGSGQASEINAPMVISNVTYTNYLGIYQFGLNALVQF